MESGLRDCRMIADKRRTRPDAKIVSESTHVASRFREGRS